MTVGGPRPLRLPLIDQPEDPAVREQFAQLAAGSGILNLHRMMAHAPALLEASGDMALALRRDAELPRSLAELAILPQQNRLQPHHLQQRQEHSHQRPF